MGQLGSSAHVVGQSWFSWRRAEGSAFRQQPIGKYRGTMNVALLAEEFGLPNLVDRLAQVEQRLLDVLASTTPDLAGPSTRVTAAGGKRLRPILTIASAATVEGRFDERVIAGAASVELVQVGSLIHDDIFDRAATRRGVETINSAEGDGHAVLAGDFVLARAGEEAAKVSAEVAGTLARTITELCLGQHLETVDLHDPERTVESHFDSIRGKTASLLRASCRIGGLCADLSDSAVEGLADFGTAFGMQFQIVDDVLDIISTPELLGKPVGNDVRSGVYTLPVLLTLAGPKGPELRSLLTERDGDDVISDDTIDRALALIECSGSIADAMDVADDFTEQAVRALDAVPESPATNGLRRLPALYRDWALTTLGPPSRVPS